MSQVSIYFSAGLEHAQLTRCAATAAPAVKSKKRSTDKKGFQCAASKAEGQAP